MTQTIEQRLKPTLIRRRARKEDETPSPAGVSEASKTPVAQETQAQAQTSMPSLPSTPTGLRPTISPEIKSGLISRPPAAGVKTSTESSLSVPKKPGILATQELEEKFKRTAKKKLSKAEMELEEIKRSGGLKHFVQSAVEDLRPEIKDRVFEPGPRRKGKQIRREFHKPQITERRANKKVIKISESIAVTELSKIMGVKAQELVKRLMDLGVMVTLNQSVDADTATLLAQEYDYTVERTEFKEENMIEEARQKRAENIIHRSPIVTVMGHVDHGKTSVLDRIRKANVAEGEAGGITQHIGAYTVTIPKGKITFLDTPGHAAFTMMRARGAKATDIVVLVVAADDGVMPQTKEAIDHARAAKVPIIVAINKIDKPDANPERTKRTLSEYNVIPEDWGGDTICVNTSARSGEGIEHLMEMILLQAEMMELKADTNSAAKGTIIESRLDRGRGPTATLLVQEGTVKIGLPVVCGLYYGKIRSLINDRGEPVESAGPSEPVEVIGLSGVPEAGDELIEVADDKYAKILSESRQQRMRMSTLAKASRVTLEDLQRQIAQEGLKELSIVLKTDVHGSVEAIRDALLKLSTEKVKVSVAHAGVGAVTESDVMLAMAGHAIIVGFNVVPDSGVVQIAEQEGVEIRRYSIIYELLDDVRKAMEGLLAPIAVEKITGHFEVRQLFSISKVGTIAGGVVKDGKIVRTARARLIRDGAVIQEGKLGSLKRFKDDAREVTEGQECGMSIENYNDIKEGDVIEAYIIEEIAQKL